MKNISFLLPILFLLLYACSSSSDNVELEKNLPGNYFKYGNRSYVISTAALISPYGDQAGLEYYRLYLTFSTDDVKVYEDIDEDDRDYYGPSGDVMFIEFNGIHPDYIDKGKLEYDPETYRYDELMKFDQAYFIKNYGSSNEKEIPWKSGTFKVDKMGNLYTVSFNGIGEDNQALSGFYIGALEVYLGSAN